MGGDFTMTRYRTIITPVYALIIALWSFGTPFLAGAAPGDITTVAGGNVGDGGAATDASLNSSEDISIDGSGNLFIADTKNHRIRKVDPSGVITTVAGNGISGFSGDGGAATDASLYGPESISTDGSGNLYIADTKNHRIRKVDPSGIITTVAGASFDGFSGDGGPATGESLDSPSGVFADGSGNLYIADTKNHRIRKVDPSGIITTVAGNGTEGFTGDGGAATDASLDSPNSVFVDGSGHLYIADWGNQRIRKMDASGIITTVAGGREGNYGYVPWYTPWDDGDAATDASLGEPRGVFVDGSGNLYIADARSDRIGKVDPSGIISTVAAGLGDLRGIFGDGSGDLYIVSSYRIWKRDLSGATSTVAGGGGLGDGGAATDATLYAPGCIFVDGSGNLYIVDMGNNRIRKVDASGNISTVAGNGDYGFSDDGGAATDASLGEPGGIFVDGSGDLYIADMGNNRIRKVDASGTISTIAGNGDHGFSGDGGPATRASMSHPENVSVDASGNLYIADSENNRIRKVDASGIISTVAGRGITDISDMLGLGPSGDGGPATDAALSFPSEIFVDRTGNLYIAHGAVIGRIRRVDASGTISTVAGTGFHDFSMATGEVSIGDGGPATDASLVIPSGVFVDRSGHLYIADSDNNRVRKVNAETGTITTVVGNGDPGFSGDGGPATDASLAFPRDIFVDGMGNVYIADTVNNRIRVVEGIASPTTIEADVAFEIDVPTVSMPALGPAVPGRGPVASTIPPSPGPGLNDPQETGTVRTVAGGSAGDGLPAVEASLLHPNGVVVDGEGNLYISDEGNNRVRRVETATGTISTVSGTGLFGFSGDDGPATDARLSVGIGIALDGAGNLYVADKRNHRIRRVNVLTGAITTMAGTGKPGFSGDGGPAVDSELSSPEGIAVDRSGNLFVADGDNHHIRMIDVSTRLMTTVAGSGGSGYDGDGGSALAAQVGSPISIGLDASGNLYVGMYGWNSDLDASGNFYMKMYSVLRRVDARTGAVVTVAGGGEYIPADAIHFSGDGGPATEARFGALNGIALDAEGNLFVSDWDNHRVRRIDTQTGIVTTLVGTGVGGFSGDGGPAAEAELSAPGGVALDGKGSLYVADSDNNRVRRMDLLAGTIVTVAGGSVGDGRPAVEAQLAWPSQTVQDDAGNLYIADTSNHRIRKVDAQTGRISTVAGTGMSGFAGDGGRGEAARLASPSGLAIDTLGNLLIADMKNHRIRKFDPQTGIITTVVGDGFRDEYRSGRFAGDGGPAMDASLNYPAGISVDEADNLYIADTSNRRIRRADATTGIITTVAGRSWSYPEPDVSSEDNGPATDASLNYPQDVALDGAGNLFIADTGNHRIRKVDLDTGIITTVAGNGFKDDSGYGSGRFSGDGGPATDASLNFPSSVAIDGAGNLLIGDTDNDRVRMIGAMTGMITTVAGSETRGRSEGDEGYPLGLTGKPLGVYITPSGDLLISDSINNRVRRIAGIAAPSISAVAADFDGDGMVGFTDFLQFAGHFGSSEDDEGYSARFDLDQDGSVGFSDFLLFAQAFGRKV